MKTTEKVILKSDQISMTYEKDKIHPEKKKEGNYLMFHQRKGVEETTWLLIL